MTAPAPHSQPMDTAARHTATPWVVRGQKIFDSSEHTMSVAYCGQVYGAGVCADGQVRSFSIDDEMAEANAAFIVEAVNSHASLKARIQELEDLSRFLLDRLDEHDPGDDAAENDFHGHIAPPMARLRTALESKPAGETK